MAVTTGHERPAERGCQPLSFPAFVALIAGMMAIPALATDAMLPALPAISKSLDIIDPNQQQWIIAVYITGIGVAQLFYGPLSDRFGRKPVLLYGYGLFIATSLFAAFSSGFKVMIAARILQGMAGACSRVLATSIVRDCFSGRKMAKVMSLAVIIFMGVPILAPTIGALILKIAPWQGIFIFLALSALVMFLLVTRALPETLHPEDRRGLDVTEIFQAARVVFTNRTVMGYTLALTLIEGGLLGYIYSVEQIFIDYFNTPQMFTLAFAGGGVVIIFASVVNSSIVEKVGMHRLGHFALLMLIVTAALHSLLVLNNLETPWVFILMQGLTMFFFSLAVSNFGSIAMEPVGHIAGMASSIQGFFWLVGGSLLGTLIGQAYNGTPLPVTFGNAFYGCIALIFVLWVERGRLFISRES
ncbi:MAG: multidrug effflux MFS transporter [Zymomonas mobilis subsp. pomaceae]|uniref:multidrug effflux MFS transporter n=1 Tax=Zymomonas mobilis TaxID=542 RepID=UPI0039ED4CCA